MKRTRIRIINKIDILISLLLMLACFGCLILVMMRFDVVWRHLRYGALAIPLILIILPWVALYRAFTRGIYIEGNAVWLFSRNAAAHDAFDRRLITDIHLEGKNGERLTLCGKSVRSAVIVFSLSNGRQVRYLTSQLTASAYRKICSIDYAGKRSD